MGNQSEFIRVYDVVRNINFNIDTNVSVFETNIRSTAQLSIRNGKFVVCFNVVFYLQ